jgi:hypothetical protein
MTTMLFAHAKWFVDDPSHHAPDLSFLLSTGTLVAGIVAAGAAVLAYLAGNRFDVPSVLAAPDERVAALVRRLPAASVGLTLPVLALQDRFLVPGVTLAGVPGAEVLALAEALVGAWLVTGWRPRLAARALAILCGAVIVVGSPIALVEAGYIAGIALYSALGGTRRGLRVLARALGASLVAVALTEKLAVPGITLAVLHAHPELDPLALFGAQVPDATFVRLAGASELLLGLLIASGAGGRGLALLAAVPFLATVPIFGVAEVVGHLPIYAALVALAVAVPARRGA